jgi:hypothetical protein
MDEICIFFKHIITYNYQEIFGIRSTWKKRGIKQFQNALDGLRFGHRPHYIIIFYLLHYRYFGFLFPVKQIRLVFAYTRKNQMEYIVFVVNKIPHTVVIEKKLGFFAIKKIVSG